MAITIRQYVKFLDKEQKIKLFKNADLTEEEYWLLTYAYIENRMVVNTCRKLNMSEAKYHYKLNEALIKLKYEIINNPKIYSLL